MEETKTSSTALGLIEKAGDRVKGNILNAMVGTICFLTPFFLAVLIPVVLFAKFDQEWLYMLLMAVAVAIWGPMEIGYIRYFKKLTAGEDPSPLSVFKGFATKNVFIYFISGVVMFLLYALGFALAIFPMYIMLAFYGMVFFYLENEEDNSSKDIFSAMKVCSKDMVRSRILMLSYKFFFHIVYILMFAIALLAGKLLLGWAETTPIWATIVAVVAVVAFVLVYAIVTIYYHSTNQCLFDELPARNQERTAINEKEKIARINKSKGVVAAEPAKVAEPVAVKEEKPVEKTTAKTTAKANAPVKATKTAPKGVETKKAEPKKSVAKETAPKQASTTIKPPARPAAKSTAKAAPKAETKTATKKTTK